MPKCKFIFLFYNRYVIIYKKYISFWSLSLIRQFWLRDYGLVKLNCEIVDEIHNTAGIKYQLTGKDTAALRRRNVVTLSQWIMSDIFKSVVQIKDACDILIFLDKKSIIFIYGL